MNNSSPAPRRQIAYVGPWNTIQLDYRDPYVVTFWSIAYAGLGFILLDRYFRGFILLAGEIYLNFASHLNMSIYYTLLGQFDNARQVLDTRWFVLYLAVYCFAVLSSYRETLIVNNTYRLAERENAKIQNFAMNANAFSVLNTVSPYLPAFFSAVMPGTGCFLLQRMNRALYLMVLWSVVAVLSGVYTSITWTFAGQFEHAKQALNIQWFLNIPSLLFFSIYEAYQCALENNKLFRKELTQHLQSEYQNPGFKLPIGVL